MAQFWVPQTSPCLHKCSKTLKMWSRSESRADFVTHRVTYSRMHEHDVFDRSHNSPFGAKCLDITRILWMQQHLVVSTMDYLPSLAMAHTSMHGFHKCYGIQSGSSNTTFFPGATTTDIDLVAGTLCPAAQPSPAKPAAGTKTTEWILSTDDDVHPAGGGGYLFSIHPAESSIDLHKSRRHTPSKSLSD